MKKAWIYIASLGLIALGTKALGWDGRQVLATAIFSGFILGTLLFWKFRLAFAFLGIVALLATDVLDLPHLIEFASLDIILFLVGMMVVVGFLEERRFFEAVIEKALTLLPGRAKLLIASMMAMAALSAALMDEVTSILFMSAITSQLTKRFRLDPVPFIIMIVFATNIGSSATVVGNPIGVMIALRGGLTFVDFLRWATPIAVAGLLIAIPLSFWYYAKELTHLDQALRHRGKVLEVEQIPTKDLLLSSLLFLGTIAGLVLHHQLESLLGLEKNTMLIGVAAFFAGIALFLERDRARALVEERVDWWTLTFFMLFFASAGTLRYVGVTRRIADGFITLTGGREGLLLAAMTWGSGLLSAFMDNVLAVGTLIPVVNDLQEMGAFVKPLWWGLLFGGTFLGNLTLIGSTANIVALGILERDEGVHISFLRWLKPGLIVAIPTLLLAHLLLYLQLPLMR